jgi:hypothetical protein
MKKVIIAVIFFAGIAYAQLNSYSPFGSKLSTGVQLGFSGGIGVQLNSTFSNFAQGFPFSARIGISYIALDPGNSADVRKIFINDATDGVPEESGHRLDFRLDLLHQVDIITSNSYAFFGPRYSMFTGGFVYVGGNEDFDVTTNQFGVGAGLETYFRMAPKLNLVLSTGVDYYFSSAISGHDTAYNPDGDNVNPRHDYNFNDADNAVNQPKFDVRIMAGFNYSF